MPDSVQITVDESSAREFQRAISRLQNRLEMAAPSAVRFASRRFVASIRSRTVRAGKLPVVEKTVETRYGSPAEYWRIVNDIPGREKYKSRRYPRAKWTRAQVRRANPRLRAGLAKAMWALAGRKVGGGAVALPGNVHMRRDATTVARRLGGSNPSIRIENRLGYGVEALVGGGVAVSASLSAASRAITHYVDKRISKETR